jgi:RimJ/RimL family protein N-acetyltransferase
MALPEIIATPRLRLRPFRDEDGPWLGRALGRFEIARMLIAVPHPFPEGRAGAWLGRIGADRARGGGLYAVEAGGEPVGCAALTTESDDLELGYWLLPEVWGRGYATEAGAALRDRAFAAGAPALKARHAVDNPASARVLAKLGFRRIGESPRWYQARRMDVPSAIYRLERRDWPAPRRLETPRLELRPLAPADAPAIRRLAGDFEVARRTARIPHPFPEGAAEAFVASASADLAAAEEIVLAIAERGDPALLGCCGLMRRADGSFELGYWLGRPSWGRGYATEAVSALADHAFRATGAPYLRAGVFPDNLASMRVLHKAGFVESGTDWCPTPARDFDGVATRLFVLTRAAWARRACAAAEAGA